ncbi:hypothetical protein FB451DRAFT_570746 [Mycena latifolia]|nr:hypothetical protein FB451DRAFT_570746 [Mycena latifolia]
MPSTAIHPPFRGVWGRRKPSIPLCSSPNSFFLVVNAAQYLTFCDIIGLSTGSIKCPIATQPAMSLCRRVASQRSPFRQHSAAESPSLSLHVSPPLTYPPTSNSSFNLSDRNKMQNASPSGILTVMAANQDYVESLEDELRRTKSEAAQKLAETSGKVTRLQGVVARTDKELRDKDSALREMKEKLRTEREAAERTKVELTRKIAFLKEKAARPPLRPTSRANGIRPDGKITASNENVKARSNLISENEALHKENARLTTEKRNLRNSLLTAAAQATEQLEQSYSEQLRLEREKSAQLEQQLHRAQAQNSRMALAAAPARPTKDPRVRISSGAATLQATMPTGPLPAVRQTSASGSLLGTQVVLEDGEI